MAKHNKIKKLFFKKSKKVTPKHFITYVLASLALVALLVLAAYGAVHLVNQNINQSRQERIVKIYDHLRLDDSYRTIHVNIFGERRTYEWDASRSYASSMEYAHTGTQKTTFADVKARIERAGFTYTGQEYSGPLTQYHFKNANDEYIRLKVVPKSFEDSIVFGTPLSQNTTTLDENEDKVYVTIKINLDDNNE